MDISLEILIDEEKTQVHIYMLICENDLLCNVQHTQPFLPGFPMHTPNYQQLFLWVESILIDSDSSYVLLEIVMRKHFH